eukprot:14429500-Alexandrium_andersonii.AAC.1
MYGFRLTRTIIVKYRCLLAVSSGMTGRAHLCQPQIMCEEYASRTGTSLANACDTLILTYTPERASCVRSPLLAPAHRLQTPVQG